jgi:2-C-methyl-D-erythritol 2,4-cyclodiphosphate synthase
MRTGIGYDIHRLVQGRTLVIGGVEIDSPIGPEAHSDGDVVVHAVCDALLGALGRGDIGMHFPDTDERWRGARSLDFLLTVRRLLDGDGYAVANIDTTVILERPKLAPHFDRMRRNMADALGIDPGRVNVKAGTNEGVGELGAGRAAAAIAVALVTEQAGPDTQAAK